MEDSADGTNRTPGRGPRDDAVATPTASAASSASTSSSMHLPSPAAAAPPSAPPLSAAREEIVTSESPPAPQPPQPPALFAVEHTEEAERVGMQLIEEEQRRCYYRAHRAVLALLAVRAFEGDGAAPQPQPRPLPAPSRLASTPPPALPQGVSGGGPAVPEPPPAAATHSHRRTRSKRDKRRARRAEKAAAAASAPAAAQGPSFALEDSLEPSAPELTPLAFRSRLLRATVSAGLTVQPERDCPYALADGDRLVALGSAPAARLGELRRWERRAIAAAGLADPYVALVRHGKKFVIDVTPTVSTAVSSVRE